MRFENSRLRYKKMLIVIIPLLILFFVFGFLTYYSTTELLGSNQAVEKKTYDIDEYDYHLRSNATELQVTLFDELKTALNEGNDLIIAESVVKNYVSDAYTWDNKKGQWDVGGMYYIYSPMKWNFYLQLKDQFYGLLDKYQKENKGSSNLLEVSSVEILSSSEADSLYEIDGSQYRSFDIVCSWKYTEDSKFADRIDNRMFFKVIKNSDNRFEIVMNYEG